MTPDEFVNKLHISRNDLQKIQGLTMALEAFSKALEGNAGRELVESALKSQAENCVDLISRLIPGVTRGEIERLLAQLESSPHPDTTHTSIIIALSKLVGPPFPNK
jgi:hypothetical protein